MDPELRDIFDKYGSEAVHIFLEVIDGQDTDAFRALEGFVFIICVFP